MGRPRKETSSKVSRKEIDWTEDRVNMIKALYLNGFSDEEVAKLIPCSVATLKYRINQVEEVKVAFSEAKKLAVSEATVALEKIAKGFFEYEVTYGTEFKLRTALRELFGEMLALIPAKKREDFEKRAELLLSEGEILKTYKKYYPPNKDAINKILDAHQSDVWDQEAKRKKIPDVKINITMDQKQIRSKKALPADYEVIQN